MQANGRTIHPVEQEQNQTATTRSEERNPEERTHPATTPQNNEQVTGRTKTKQRSR